MNGVLLAAVLLFLVVLGHASVLGRWRDRIAGVRPTAGPGNGAAVKVSVIIPVRNCADTLVPLLQDLYAQRYPKEDLEVLVVDDHSTDRTVTLVAEMARTWPALKLHSLAGVEEGKKAGITKGVEQATGELIVLTDADARCGAERIARIASFWTMERSGLVIMPVRTMAGEGLLGLMQQEEQWALQAATAGSALDRGPLLANGANLAFSREAFKLVGGYRNDRRASGDDVFLLASMLKAGIPVGYLLDPEAAVEVRPEPTWSAWWTQRLRWAGKMRDARTSAAWPAAALVVAVPWLLLLLSSRVAMLQVGQQLMYTGSLLVATWLLWIVPVIALVNAQKAVYGGTPRVIRTLVGLLLFSVYAPLVALSSLVWRPQWKGRRV
jgi:cellulose synthase/poly-beta-1,6-N-acetylglucosamine synthase-like glycosyltransferase